MTQGESKSHWFGVVLALCAGIAIAFVGCILGMKFAVGNGSPPLSIVGISGVNLIFSLKVAGVISGVTAALSLPLCFAGSSWGWVAMLPAILVPIVGVVMFTICIMAGSG